MIWATFQQLWKLRHCSVKSGRS